MASSTTVEELNEQEGLAELGGFKILRIQAKHLPEGSVRYLYIKQHTMGTNNAKKRQRHQQEEEEFEKEEEEEEQNSLSSFPNERTLFVTNPSYYYQEQDFYRIFESAGPIERVVLGALETSHSSSSSSTTTTTSTFYKSGCAHIIFERSKSLRRVLKWTIADTKKIQVSSSSLSPNNHSAAAGGLSQWVSNYRSSRVAPEVLKKRADIYMQHFDQEEERKKKERESLAQPDEDGWITVVRTGKTKKQKVSKAPAPPAAVKAGNYLERYQGSSKDKLKSKVLDDFYAFQKREKRHQELLALKDSFAADKARIARMKGDRRFKP